MSLSRESIQTRDAARRDLVRSLAGPPSSADLALFARTRCAVRAAAAAQAERRRRQRNNLGWALAIFASMAFLLAPAIWSDVEHLLGGEHFADFPAQLALLLLLVLCPAMLAALMAVWRGQREMGQGRRGL
jgi:hypothetical protein